MLTRIVTFIGKGTRGVAGDGRGRGSFAQMVCERVTADGFVTSALPALNAVSRRWGRCRAGIPRSESRAITVSTSSMPASRHHSLTVASACSGALVWSEGSSA